MAEAPAIGEIGLPLAQPGDDGSHALQRELIDAGLESSQAPLETQSRAHADRVERAEHRLWRERVQPRVGLGEQPQYLYSVRFPARVLWGDEASERDSLYLDLWDAHLDPA